MNMAMATEKSQQIVFKICHCSTEHITTITITEGEKAHLKRK